MKLKNYLRTHRRRAGFTQAEIAYLLGGESGTTVSRYERRARIPNLEAAFAFEVIFGASCKTLFAGHFSQVERQIHERARLLADKLGDPPTDLQTEAKIKCLRQICTRK